jgi:hypothetical protein
MPFGPLSSCIRAPFADAEGGDNARFLVFGYHDRVFRRCELLRERAESALTRWKE